MDKLKELRKKMGWTLAKLSSMTNIATNTLNQYELGKREPSLEVLNILAETFHVSVDYLMGREVDNNIQAIKINRSVTKIPVFGKIPAGVPIDMIEDSLIEDYEEIPTDWLIGGNEYFALRVKGESMMPKFENGDVIILKKQEDCESGAFCAVSINHTECTFKKVLKKENGITLMPLNPEFEPLFFSKQEVVELPVTILGIVK